MVDKDIYECYVLNYVYIFTLKSRILLDLNWILIDLLVIFLISATKYIKEAI